MCSEEKIIDLIANRDESGMRELMERYQRPLMKLAMNMLDSLTVRKMQENVLMIRFMKYGNQFQITDRNICLHIQLLYADI